MPAPEEDARHEDGKSTRKMGAVALLRRDCCVEATSMLDEAFHF